MPKRKNTKYVSQREREEPLEKCLEYLDNEDEDNIFEDTNSDSDSDSDRYGWARSNWKRRSKWNSWLRWWCRWCKYDDNDTNNVNSNNKEVENENRDFTNIEHVAELPRKTKFRHLDEITNEENFDVLKQVENKQYSFSATNKQFQMKWFTKSRNIRKVGRQPASNIMTYSK